MPRILEITIKLEHRSYIDQVREIIHLIEQMRNIGDEAIT